MQVVEGHGKWSAWSQRGVRDKWKKAIIELLHKLTDSKNECESYRGISVLS